MSRQKKETGLVKETVFKETVEEERKAAGRKRKPSKEMTGDGTHTIAELHALYEKKQGEILLCAL